MGAGHTPQFSPQPQQRRRAAPTKLLLIGVCAGVHNIVQHRICIQPVALGNGADALRPAGRRGAGKGQKEAGKGPATVNKGRSGQHPAQGLLSSRRRTAQPEAAHLNPPSVSMYATLPAPAAAAAKTGGSWAMAAQPCPPTAAP